jgi:hypothetical protein
MWYFGGIALFSAVLLPLRCYFFEKMPKAIDADNLKDPVTVYEIMTTRKSFDDPDGEPSAPLGMDWVAMRGRPYYLKKKDAETELQIILVKKSAKPADHYTIAQINMPRYMPKNDLKRGKALV